MNVQISKKILFLVPVFFFLQIQGLKDGFISEPLTQEEQQEVTEYTAMKQDELNTEFRNAFFIGAPIERSLLSWTRILLAAKADVNYGNPSVFMYACKKMKVSEDLIKTLVQERAHINAQSNNETPLCTLVKNSFSPSIPSLDLVKYLIACKAEIGDGKALLKEALAQNKFHLVPAFVQPGVFPIELFDDCYMDEDCFKGLMSLYKQYEKPAFQEVNTFISVAALVAVVIDYLRPVEKLVLASRAQVTMFMPYRG